MYNIYSQYLHKRTETGQPMDNPKPAKRPNNDLSDLPDLICGLCDQVWNDGTHICSMNPNYSNDHDRTSDKC